MEEISESGNQDSVTCQLTQADYNPVGSLNHFLLIIATIELGKGGKAGSTHPILEALVSLEIWRGILLCIAIWIAVSPVRRGHDGGQVRIALFANRS